MRSPKTLSSRAPRPRGQEHGRDVWVDAVNAAFAGTSLMTPRSVAGASQRIATSPGVHDAQLSRGHVAHDAELSRGRVAADDAPPTNSISESQNSTVSYVASQDIAGDHAVRTRRRR